MTSAYFIKDGYRHRSDPEYALDEDTGVVWQPDVYPEAARVAELVGASCIVDVGCGSGAKLAALHPRFELLGIDLPGPNLEQCRAHYPFVELIEHDIENGAPLPVADMVLARSVVVCSDVLEHLVRPERLLRNLYLALDLAPAILLSTPERDLTWGAEHNGPPPNPCHVREWTIAELDALLGDVGFAHRWMGLTRTNDSHNLKKTILCRLFADRAALEAAEAAERGKAAG